MKKNVLSSSQKLVRNMEEKIDSWNSNELSSDPKDELSFIGKTISLVRKEKGISQTQLSVMTNIPVSVLSRYEHGTLIPNYNKLRQICNAMEVDFLVFMFKCLNEENIKDDRSRRTIREYEPCIESAKEMVRKSFLD